MKCTTCGYDDLGTGDSAHSCGTSFVIGTAPTLEAERAAPCPFCGGTATPMHTDDCYFVMQQKLRDAPKGDLSLVPEVLAAWNRRTATPVAEDVALPPLQSIGDDERFLDLLAEYLDSDSSIGPSYDPEEAKRDLIAYIDGRTAGTAGNAWVKAVHQMPPNDQAILAYGAKSLEWAVMRYSTRDGWQVETASDFHSSYPPLFWMPLPAAPSPLHPQEEDK